MDIQNATAGSPPVVPVDTTYGVKRVLYHHRTQGKAVEGVHIRGVADALRAQGLTVDIISLPGADPYASPKAMSPTRQANAFMKVVSKLPEPVFELAELAYNAVAAGRVAWYLLRHRDAGFIYERYSLFMFSTVLISRLCRLPIFLEVNDSATVARVRALFFYRLAAAIERWAFRRATGLVFVSSKFRDHVRQSYGIIASAIVTPNAANIDQFTFTAGQRAETRQRYQLDSAVVCGYLGAFVPWHAIDQFVYTIADHLAAAPHLKLLLVGDGATYTAVEEFVKERQLTDRIILTGRVAHSEVPGLLAAMDMAVLPSAGDYTSPVKLFELMACGIAPVAPDFDPIREVLVHDSTGWLFASQNVAAAVNAVLDRSRNPERLREVGRAARDYIATHRQWRNNVRQLLDFYAAQTGRKLS